MSQTKNRRNKKYHPRPVALAGGLTQSHDRKETTWEAC